MAGSRNESYITGLGSNIKSQVVKTRGRIRIPSTSEVRLGKVIKLRAKTWDSGSKARTKDQIRPNTFFTIYFPDTEPSKINPFEAQSATVSPFLFLGLSAQFD